MNIPIYQVDAFADAPFTGNPAAVCPLDAWLPDVMMQAIAAENRLSETAFFVPSQEGFQIRWFTPLMEVDLCGHATLAAAHVLFNRLDYGDETVLFTSKSGPLKVSHHDDQLVMDFPAQPALACAVPLPIQEAFSAAPIACLKAEDYIVVLADEGAVLAARPNLSALKKLDLRGVIITSLATKYDFVSRFFAPKLGIDEDPVTGSAHTQLAPYWAAALGRSHLCAKQLSARGGVLSCEVVDQRVMIAGRAVIFMQGMIDL
ncbi:MAG: PhzF family phenazine biosynthesis protein [Mariprofundales bacterium]